MSLKKPLRAILPISAVLVLTVAVFLVYLMNRPEDMRSHIAAGCSVKGYSQQLDAGYVTVEFDGARRTIKKLRVEDKSLQKQLSEQNLSDIIGVNILLTLPAREIKNAHIDLQKTDPFEFFRSTDEYDGYAVVTGISPTNSIG